MPREVVLAEVDPAEIGDPFVEDRDLLVVAPNQARWPRPQRVAEPNAGPSLAEPPNPAMGQHDLAPEGALEPGRPANDAIAVVEEAVPVHEEPPVGRR